MTNLATARSVDADLAEYMPLVHQVVSRFMAKLPPSVLRDDLVAAGTYGLVDSLRRNGAGERGAQFLWYARTRIRGAVTDELRRQDWLTRRARSRYAAGERSEESAVVLGFDDSRIQVGHIQDEARTPLELMIECCEHKSLDAAVDALPERERKIVRMHYFQGEPLRLVAEELGVSAPRASQLHARAVQMLKQVLMQ